MEPALSWKVQFYQTRRGDSPIDEFLGGLAVGERAKCVLYMVALEEAAGRLPFPYTRKVRGPVWELRPDYGGNAFRFFYFTLIAGKIVLLHAVRKKSQKLRERDVDLAAGRAEEIRGRIQEAQNERTRIQDAPPIRPRTD